MVKKTIPLTVYKASAGSGKTFTLAVEYIKLIVKDPTCYRNILAVTFTNKATEEMKMRIISQLYGLSKQLPESQTYMDNITATLGFTPSMVAIQADTALKLLLHNYNYFRVETIDKFFQSVFRNMANELDLTANLRIGLNDSQVEEQAVDELIDNLNVQDKVFGWIMQYVKENISEDKSWNVIKLIKRFGKNIFKDVYKENSDKINEILSVKDFFERYSLRLRQIRQSSKDRIIHYAEHFFDLLEENGLSVSDFRNGTRGICGYFIKLKEGIYDDGDLLTMTVVSAMSTPEKWVKKDKQKVGNPIFDLVCSTLMPFLNETERVRLKTLKLYKTADLTLKHLNQLRLLESIERTVREMNDKANRFLLSDTQHLLNGIIQESDSPFVFEKIGTYLTHIMIDEFQDTSTIQWKNFKVLLQECMSQTNTHNLIVGDVKQSIYRWRAGDWKLLNNIEKEFDTIPNLLDIKVLTTNYRSDRFLVEFNNAFFTLAAIHEYNALSDVPNAQQLIQAYTDIVQHPYNTAPEGWVEIELLPTELYHEQIMRKVSDTVDGILQRGYTEKSIAILCRSKTTIQNIADYFSENRPDLPMISDEAFRLDASTAVNAIISSLRFICNPDNIIERAFLEQNGLLSVMERDRDALIAMPLYELVLKVYSLFPIERFTKQSAYILAFFDQVSGFVTENMSDINDFLEEWDSTIHEKTIPSSDVNGIRLLTIHKSKGLEFEHVIIPACDWKLEQQTTLWCTPAEEPFNEMPLVPIDFNKKNMMGSIYETDYNNEHLQNIVDNLNLLYVAFTRAKKTLHVFGKRTNSSMRSHLIEEILEELSQKLNVTYTGDITDKNDNLQLSYGTPLTMINAYKDRMEENIVIEKNVFKHVERPLIMKDVISYDSCAEFKQSNQSIDFLMDYEDNEQTKYIKIGNVLHRIFSSIKTIKDIDNALKKLENDGILYDSELKKDQLINMLRKRFENENVRDWFSDRWTLFNECTILHVDPNDNSVVRHRPDRVITDGKQFVVIDFKFGKSNEKYYEQVRTYMKLLHDMGCQNISGYLWFVYSNKIEEVK